MPSFSKPLVLAALCCSFDAAVAFRFSAGAPQRHSTAACAMPAMIPAHTASLGRVATSAARMQSPPSIDDSSQAFYNEYVQTDPVTGERTAISLDEKEKLYLECLDAYYNEGGKQLLGDEEYEQLKLDLDFEGRKIATFSKDEIRFVLANKRFKMGQPTLSDSEYDELRLKLKKTGSTVVIHEGAACNVETGICKSDLSIDAGKTRLLYLPGTAGGLILTCEVIFWTLHLDPILSIIIGAIPAYFFGVWFTENVFAQKPLVTQGPCPNCQTLQTIYFGDLFSVGTDGLAGPPTPPKDQLACKCPNCKSDLTADRVNMLITSTVKD